MVARGVVLCRSRVAWLQCSAGALAYDAALFFRKGGNRWQPGYRASVVAGNQASVVAGNQASVVAGYRASVVAGYRASVVAGYRASLATGLSGIGQKPKNLVWRIFSPPYRAVKALILLLYFLQDFCAPSIAPSSGRR